MGIITLPTTFVDGTTPTAAQFNGDFSAIVNEFNGSISNANISASAAIAESKLAFNSSTGHNHDGVTSRLIPKGFAFFIPGTQTVANDQSLNPRAPSAQTVSRLDAYVKTAPTGADLIARVYNVTQGVVVATITIAAGAQTATQSSMTTASIAQGDVLRADVTQIGSTIAGINLTLTLS
jgi:hypothetical protein